MIYQHPKKREVFQCGRRRVYITFKAKEQQRSIDHVYHSLLVGSFDKNAPKPA